MFYFTCSDETHNEAPNKELSYSGSLRISQTAGVVTVNKTIRSAIQTFICLGVSELNKCFVVTVKRGRNSYNSIKLKKYFPQSLEKKRGILRFLFRHSF